MRFLFSLITLALLQFTVLAQNYELVQPGTERYFNNTDGYLKGIRIDSVKTVGNDVHFYPFKTVRGLYWNQTQDTNGAGWLGEVITMQPDGTHLIGTHWDDTVIIRTQADLNESWTFYNDATDTFYTATVTAIDTMTVWGTPDSVKRIRLEAKNSNGILTTDPLNHMELVLSKTNGLVRTCDLYLVPMHEPGKVYHSGIDRYLDAVYDNPRSPEQLFFNAVEFYNPLLTEIYDFEIGDNFQNTAKGSGAPYGYRQTLSVSWITSKTVLADKMIYTEDVWTETNKLNGDPKITTPTKGGFEVSAKPLVNTPFMPEEKGNYYMHMYYKPDDTTFCMESPFYRLRTWNIDRKYKMKLGQLSYYEDIPSEARELVGALVYWKKGNKSCGTYIPLSTETAVKNIDDISVYPNPASDKIYIEVPTGDFSTALYNTMGQLVATNCTSQKNTTEMNISQLPTGLYHLEVRHRETVHRQRVVVAR